jgi:hypothetical protein
MRCALMLVVMQEGPRCPPVHMIERMEVREITRYRRGHPDEGR